MPLMDKKGYFHRIGFFPAPSTFDVSQNIPLAIQLKKKKQYACAHTPVASCTIKEWGRENERIEKLYHSSQNVVEPNYSFLVENVFLIWRNRILK